MRKPKFSRDSPELICGTAPKRLQFSLIVRTQGNRIGLLGETLLSISSQTEASYEVLLMCHRSPKVPEALLSLNALISTFPEDFQAKISLHSVDGGTRSRPLNEGLRAAAGTWVGFLDDDDLLLDIHFETFRKALEVQRDESAFHTFGARRFVKPLNLDGSGFPYMTTGIEMVFGVPFALIRQLHGNFVPICNFVVALDLVRDRNIEFDESLDLYEDWDFLMSVQAATDIIPIETFTTVINVRDDGTNSVNDPNLAEAWLEARKRVIEKMASQPRCFSSREMDELVKASERYVELTEFKNKYGYLSKVVGPIYPLILKVVKLIPAAIKRAIKRLLN